MRMSSIFLAAVALALSIAVGSATSAAEEALWLHPKVAPLPTETMGPFVRLPDNRILAVDSHNVLSSGDEGQTWESWPLETGMDFEVSNERALLVTREGALILACMNMKEKVWTWNSAIHDADPGTTLPTYALRSLDFGKTWNAAKAPRRVERLRAQHDPDPRRRDCFHGNAPVEQAGAPFGADVYLPRQRRLLEAEQCRRSRRARPPRGRDRGHRPRTERRAALEVDPHEPGQILAGVVGRQRLLADHRAFDIPASSAPGQLLRLASYRVMLVWNRPSRTARRVSGCAAATTNGRRSP